MRGAQPDERAVRAAEILKVAPAVAQREVSVAARHELVGGEHHVALLAAEHDLRRTQVEGVMGHAGLVEGKGSGRLARS